MTRNSIKWMSGLLIFIFTLPMSLAANNAFTLNGQAINPVCVWLLVNRNAASGHSVLEKNNSLLSYFKQPPTQDIIYAINLNACQASQTNGEMLKQDDWVKYQFPWGLNNNFDNQRRRGEFSYHYVGKTNNGLDVLHAVDSGGGTGQFDRIIVLKREIITQYQVDSNNQQRPVKFTSLILIGNYSGGDRNVGSFKTMNIIGNAITGTRYSLHNALNGKKVADEKFSFTISADKHQNK